MALGNFDFIIVGGGLAGLVLGSRLSEDPDISVLVIESGPDFRNDPRVNIPAMWSALLADQHAAWQFKTVPQDSLGGREIKFSQGRVLGGSSALNGLSFSATSKVNIDAWENLGNPGWNWNNFSKAMAKAYHSDKNGKGNGPLELTIPDEDSEWPQVWRDTLKALGFSVTNDPFSGQVCGGLTVPDSIHSSDKQRSYSGNTYLKLALGRPNFALWTETSVDKILFDKHEDDAKLNTTTATGVQYTTKAGDTNIVEARKEIILTAGAINSPKILELSGVGDKNHLDTLDIPTVIDNPFVGENLQNHAMVNTTFEAKGGEKGFETLEKLSRGDPDTIAAAMDAYTSRKAGPFSRSGANHAAQLPFPGIGGEDGRQEVQRILRIENLSSNIGKTTEAFAKAHESFIHAVLESPTEASATYLSAPVFTGFNSDGSQASALQIDAGEQYFTIVLLLAHPLSRGSVHLTPDSTSTSSHGLAIDPRYLSHPLDVEVLASHLQYAAETLAATAPLASHLKPGGKRNPTGPQTGSFADLENVKRYVREMAVGAQHYTGTCSMMPRDMGGVVDSTLRVYGCRNLRVCDASVIPITPRTNPQATVYGIAEMAADIIKSGA
ncbi:putative GMC oxidoreductase [Hypoxylon sp. CI-4A]|nr:putative GMC oxidoreductase [Hypoxylon sp. CI-4A]